LKNNKPIVEIAHDNRASSSRYKLYPDFTLTKDNCASEPIHRPIAIQGQGHLLVVDTRAEHALHAISEKLASYFGFTMDTIWAEPIENWIPEPILYLLKSIGTVDYSPMALPRLITLTGTAYSVTHHQHSGKLKVEFEPEADTKVDEQLIGLAIQGFRQIDELDALYAEASQLIAQAYGYDRVMIYKFDEDQHGAVVGEHKIDSLESFLGLHYPATDIPKMARDLFLLVKSRAIADVNTHNDSLEFNPALGEVPPYLDLSHSQLRAISPIHIQYLQNMGVHASLTFAIIINGQLWGLIACHHGSPRQVLFHHRLIGESFSTLLATRIMELELKRQTEIEAASRAVESSVLDYVGMSDDYRIELTEQAHRMVELCEADGFAIVLGEAKGAALAALDQSVRSSGLAPSDLTLLEIRDWLIQEGHDEVFCTANVEQDIPVSFDGVNPIGGMLATCISVLSHSYLFWFRQPVTQTVNWAGDPAHSYSVKAAKDGGDVELNPRESFAKWQTSVEGQSLRWENSALAMVGRVRQGLFKKELLHTTMLVDRSNKEFMQLTYVAAHDLREPLRTQTNYFEMLKELLEAEEYADIPSIIERAENSAARMGDLVTDLLTYSSLAVPNEHEDINLADIVEQIREELGGMLTETKAVLHVADLLTLRGDPIKLKQLLQNFITNGIKYVEPGVIPEISIFTEQNGSYWTLNVKDNGIGIDPKYHSKIFVMFQRLHGKSEYYGTGIGLAICTKVAESMGAKIGVTSSVGEGSTFWLRFHNSAIVLNH